jgi:hypothetical protein
MAKIPSHNQFHNNVMRLLQVARSQVVRQVNHTMVHTYYEIGKMIVEEEQQGQGRAEYGVHLVKELSAYLSHEFGRGFSVTNLQQMRTFYLVYQKQQTASVEFRLSWSHYLKLMRIDDEKQRKFYEIESIQNNWSVRELNRQFGLAA